MTGALQKSPGLLVLGMHRSGTSVVSRSLQLCGFDIGVRVLGASEGNETGHWEDAVAVETHEALLQAFGARWDEPFALPEDWARSDAAAQARVRIAAYLEQRRTCDVWAAKDPRMCLFGELWRQAAGDARIPLAALLVMRHPLEVAHSLSTRDGIGVAKAQLLWLDYMASAVRQVRQMPHTVIGYRDFLADWSAALSRVRALPGLAALDCDESAQASVLAFIDPARRHHSVDDDGALLPGVREAWHALMAAVVAGSVDEAAASTVNDAVQSVRRQLAPILKEFRLEQRALWLRAGRAEAKLAGIESGERDPIARIELLGRSLSSNHADVVQMFAASLEQGATADRKADARLERLAGQVGDVGEKLVAIYSGDIRRMQDELAGLHRTYAAHTEAAIARVDRDRAKAEEDRTKAEQDRAKATQLFDEVRVLLAREKNGRTQDLEAQIEGLRRTNSGMAEELRRLREDSALLAQIRGSHSWALTRPLRVLRRLLSGQWSSDDSARLRRLLRLSPPSRVVAGRAASTSVALAEVVPNDDDGVASVAHPSGLPDVFVWAVIDWHFRTQRPQHLARALAARGHRVFYVSNNFVDTPEPGFAVEPLDASGRLFQLQLHLPGAPAIYHAMPDDGQARFLQQSLASVLAWTQTVAGISLVQHPYWREPAYAIPNARVVYDCMDHHAGFANNASDILEAERRLIRESDLVVVTSDWLHLQIAPEARRIALVRNAAEYGHFSIRPEEVFSDPAGRKVIGYFGAIADWFDTGLVRKVAQAFPDALVVLVGRDTAGVGEALRDCPNVRMVAEVPYAALPYWVHGFDVCLLPFQVSDLTLATNPVKAYEYLAAGKPLVSVALPELTQFHGVAAVADTAETFVAAVGRALHDSGGADAAATRRAFAAQQTWEHRACELDRALDALESPRVTVVVLTYNNLAYTKACLESIERYSDYDNLEVLAVDNASSDGSVDWLRDWAESPSAAGHSRRLLLNGQNLGFAAGNNVGLAAATGEFLVILNNDTYVTPGWVRTLCAHFRGAPQVGLVGPVTNNIGNEARIDIHYADMRQMIEAAALHTRAHPGASFALPTVAFFCVAMPRSTYERVGGLDERFGMGFFEDDDYCRRVEAIGLQIRCAEDVFIHHHLSASFDAIGMEAKQALFVKNKALYEAKWGAWTPHAYRAARTATSAADQRERL